MCVKGVLGGVLGGGVLGGGGVRGGGEGVCAGGGIVCLWQWKPAHEMLKPMMHERMSHPSAGAVSSNAGGGG